MCLGIFSFGPNAGYIDSGVQPHKEPPLMNNYNTNISTTKLKYVPKPKKDLDHKTTDNTLFWLQTIGNKRKILMSDE